MATGAVGTVLCVGTGTSTDHNDTAAQVRTITWADVVRRANVARADPKVMICQKRVVLC